eukprot:1900293-Prymnesium_polylepis.1
MNDNPELCDGITVVNTLEESTTHKTFSLSDINKNIPDNCYEFMQEGDETPLAFICQECDEGMSVDIALTKPASELEDWMKHFPDYAVWAEEDGIVKHLKHLTHTPTSKTTPSRPVTVRLV